MDQGVDSFPPSFELKKDTGLTKVWLDFSGSQVSKKFPVVRSEHLFEDINDPQLILKAINEDRALWDDSLQINEELTKYSGPHVKVFRNVNEPVLR